MSSNVNNQFDFFKLVNVDANGNIGVNIIGGGTGSTGTDLFEVSTGSESIVSINTVNPNSASGDRAFVGGGQFSQANGKDSAVIAGNKNLAGTLESVVVGGKSNNIGGSSPDVFIGGGTRNVVNVTSTYGKTGSPTFGHFVIGGDYNQILGSTLGNEYTMRSGIVGGTNNILRGRDTVAINSSNLNMYTSNSNTFINGLSDYSIGCNYTTLINTKGTNINGVTSSLVSGNLNQVTSGQHHNILGYRNSVQNFNYNTNVLSNYGNITTNKSTYAYTYNYNNTLIGGLKNRMYWNIQYDYGYSYNNNNAILGGYRNTIRNNTQYGSYSHINNVIIGGQNNNITTTDVAVKNTVIIGGESITATQSDTVYLPKLIMTNVPTASSGLTTGSVWSDGGTLKIV